jgi:CheY-like chemotaxis protein/CHASE3 domain sensor protein/HPt (histidine-containing phosphotransfer) domain-containing protein
VVAGILVTLALCVGVILLFLTSSSARTNANARVEHTRDVAATLDETAGVLTDTELADSRYLLTGANRYRTALNDDADALERHLRRLGMLLVDDPAQLVRLTAVEPLLRDMLSRMQMAGISPVAPRSTETEPLSERISAQLGEMRGEERRLLSQQGTDLDRSINAQSFAFLGLLLLASSVPCVIYARVGRNIKRREEARTVLGDARRRSEAESGVQAIAMARARFDIRSALTAILGHCDLPLDAGTPAQDRFDSIRGQTVQIIAAVNNILSMTDFSEAPAPPIASRLIAHTSNVKAAIPSPTMIPAAMRFSGRILVAEDDPDLQQMIKFYLQQAGAEVTVVSDGQLACDQALLAWKLESPFDLILMDVQMPKLDGPSATILLRNAGYTNPIVALTANATKLERDRCFTAGCNGFLTKPLVQEEFLQTMTRYLQPGSHLSGASTDSEFTADPEFVALRESFQAEIPSRIAEIGAAVSARDFARVTDLTHRLMGTAGCYGLTAICAAATALNAAAALPEPYEAIRQCFQKLDERNAQSPKTKAA